MHFKRNILLIENQKFQFDKIIDFDCLKIYNIYPSESCYIKFIDNVRVWVNNQYKPNYREKAINYLKDFIEQNKIEMIIMDHILGGAYHCFTGIDLAEEINRSKSVENCMPVLFLSKTEHNEKNRMFKYENYKKIYPEDICTKWIHKGYFGDEILSEEYFKKMVIPEILKLFDQLEEKKFWIKFDLVINLQFPQNQDEMQKELFRIKKNIKFCNMSSAFKNLISAIYTSKNIIEIDLKTLKDEK